MSKGMRRKKSDIRSLSDGPSTRVAAKQSPLNRTASCKTALSLGLAVSFFLFFSYTHATAGASDGYSVMRIVVEALPPAAAETWENAAFLSEGPDQCYTDFITQPDSADMRVIAQGQCDSLSALNCSSPAQEARQQEIPRSIRMTLLHYRGGEDVAPQSEDWKYVGGKQVECPHAAEFVSSKMLPLIQINLLEENIPLSFNVDLQEMNLSKRAPTPGTDRWPAAISSGYSGQSDGPFVVPDKPASKPGKPPPQKSFFEKYWWVILVAFLGTNIIQATMNPQPEQSQQQTNRSDDRNARTASKAKKAN